VVILYPLIRLIVMYVFTLDLSAIASDITNYDSSVISDRNILDTIFAVRPVPGMPVQGPYLNLIPDPVSGISAYLWKSN